MWGVLTAVALGPPGDVDALDVALSDVGGDGCTETLTVASPVTATRVPQTGRVVLVHVHLQTQRVGIQYVALWGRRKGESGVERPPLFGGKCYTFPV